MENLNALILMAPVASILAQVLSSLVAYRILHKRYDSRRILEISRIIRDGAISYLNRQFLAVSIFSAILAVIIGLFFGLFTALTFCIGSTFSAISAYLGTLIAVNTNSKTAEAAKEGFRKAFATAFEGGTATGLLLTGFGLLIVSGLYIIFSILGYENPSNLVGLGFGASLVGLFARVGGGIYTKAADISADLVGKVEMGLVEDDPRNPAVIADQVGDNVGDVAGTGSDVFQSYVCTLIAAIILGVSVRGIEGVTYPMLVLGSGLISSALGSFFVKITSGSVKSSIYLGMHVSALLASLASAIASQLLFGNLEAFYATLMGILSILLIAHITEYYTSPEKKPVEEIVKASKTGPAINVLIGLSVGLEGTLIPTVIFSAIVFLAYHIEGLYGITLVAIGFLSIMATFVSMASYGPIVDNANGLITMSRVNADLRRTMDMLDSVGNITKAVCKVYAIGTSALAQVALFSAYVNAAHLRVIDAANPLTIAGMFTGGTLSFLLCSLIIKAVSRAANTMIKEIHRQLSGDKSKHQTAGRNPDYIRCINISARAALRGMFYPAILSVVVPFATGLLLGPEAMGGLVVGNLVTMLPLALFMCISGAAWDNAKKYIEADKQEGKGSPSHAASVIGDTVGDPLKDAVGPSLDIFINLIGTVALIYAAYILNS
ncbi:MAG: sodium-translocating pyrophosphatase [Candidatus Bathyarchaeia archaeon]